MMNFMIEIGARRWLAALCAGAFTALASVALLHDAQDRAIARASSLSAMQLADHALITVAGPDDEGPYTLIDPIGPGGASGLAAADEVFASTIMAGQYSTYQPVQDPFAQPIPGDDHPPIPYGPPKGRLP